MQHVLPAKAPAGGSEIHSDPPHARSFALARAGRRRKLFFTAIMLAVASAAVAWFGSRYGPLHALELKTYDLRFVLNGQRTPPPGIVLLMVDRETEAAIQDPRIFWHPYYATALRAASQGGARAIGLDVAFTIPTEQWMPDFDRQLAEAFAEVSAMTPVVLAFDSLSPPAPNLPLYLLARTQDAMGFTNLTLDADGFVRRQELLTRDDPPWQSFAARLAAVSLQQEWQRSNAADTPGASESAVRLGERTIPTDESGAMRIRYWGPAGAFSSVAMKDVLSAAQREDAAALKAWFEARIVLIGTDDVGDQQSTPFYLAGGRQRLTPGVEVQASTLATLLEGSFLEEPPEWLRMTMVFAAALLAGGCIVSVRFPAGLLALSGIVAAYLVISMLSLNAGSVLPVVPVLLSVALSGGAAYGAQALTEGKQRKLLQEYFGRYVSSEMAEELLAYGEVPLGGKRQPVTVMFTDLRNYTGYCQGRDAEQVVRELNEYFTDMSAEIKVHGGMINKFIGDGIMALFGAPLPHADDARRAVACGLRMIQRNEEFNRRRVASGLTPLVIGIGIHTGEAVVGTIGAPEKMEYTAIGDAVNIASRIEGENKTFGTRMLVSEATLQQVNGDVAFEPAGVAKMKGIEEPMMLYRTVGDE
jgi:adenylate cyclase